MNLTLVRDILGESDPDDWHHVTQEGGPTYRDTFSNSLIIGGGLEMESHPHQYVATYWHDVNLTIAWGMDLHPQGLRDSSDRDKLTFPWATFPDSACYGHLADVFWAGALIDRHAYISVDGGRGMVPWPENHVVDDTLPAAEREWTQHVTSWSVRFIDLLGQIIGSTGHTVELVKRAGFIVS